LSAREKAFVDAFKAALLDSDSRFNMDDEKTHPLYENLDTAYVNLAALVRYLREREFTGRIHVRLEDYEAEVFLDAGEPPQVRETDYKQRRTSEGDEAFRRLLVRALDAGGLISVYEYGGEADEQFSAIERSSTIAEIDEASARAEQLASSEAQEETDWSTLLRLSGDVIAAVERATLSNGADFGQTFRATRLEMADDYSFLDPATGRFQYANSAVELHASLSQRQYISGIGECLRRVVEKVATGAREGSVRERVALELAVIARRRQSQLSAFNLLPQLDRIAGTKVL
jgi:hypothetical protein